MTSSLELTEDEISTAHDARQRVVSLTGVHTDSLTVLKLGFGNGETEVISLIISGLRTWLQS
jgi:hypothetical protein